jgi:hypothetical protein
MNGIKLSMELRLELLKISDIQNVAERVLVFSEVIRYCTGQIDILKRRAGIPSVEIVTKPPPDPSIEK